MSHEPGSELAVFTLHEARRVPYSQERAFPHAKTHSAQCQAPAQLRHLAPLSYKYKKEVS